ncbi:MAG TPA: beta-phosphoglucomutase family hydrolase [Actinocrinis sp.]|uniref:HAD family hydrolase n=1 Tax=Actinocrinis sp. TaxID=1920516 RepID=UPI002DDCB282|nr:beta-phosphoglucomutase family hydrolase [Actinocrinis sp.]HEV2345649.1 beta-phosphoglucomutase family hydrolase [Actinocrinis sp.]
MTAKHEPEPTHDPSAAAVSLGLNAAIRVCLFDMDGVLTKTATVHAAAWKQTFDNLLRRRSVRMSQPFEPFDEVKDYELCVDGKPRADGVRSFLMARGIDLPEGEPDDPLTAETVQGVGNAKNEAFNELVRTAGVQRYEGSVRYIRAARSAGLRTGVVTSSANCAAVLAAADMAELFDTTFDGNDLNTRKLPGKPAPDSYLAAARALDAEAAQAAVFDDAQAGVQAGRAGGFGRVVGVDRLGQAEALYGHGADIVVQDLDQLLVTR